MAGLDRRVNGLAVRGMMAVCSLLLVGAVSPMPTSAQTYTMKIGFISIKDPQHINAEEYKKRLEARTNGRIKVEVYPAGQLGSVPRMIEGVQLGTVEQLTVPPLFLRGIDPRFQLAEPPGLFRDMAHAFRSVTDPAFRTPFLALGETKGLKGISIWIYSPTSYASTKPLRTLDDWKGMKLRILASEAEKALMSKLGATGVPISFGEVLPALQTRTIDGVRSGIGIMGAMKFYDVAKHVTVVNDTQIVIVALVSQAWLNKLPSDLQDAVVEVGREIEPTMLQVAQDFQSNAEKRWQESGGEVLRLAPEDQAKFMATVATLGDEVFGSDPALRDLYMRLKESAKRNM